jgi:hypothetical protein
VLTNQERRMADDDRVLWPVEAHEPPRFQSGFAGGWVPHAQEDLPVTLAAGVWIAVALVLFGAVLAGLAVAAVTAAGWALWRVRRGRARRVAGSGTAPTAEAPSSRASGVADRRYGRRAPGLLVEPAGRSADPPPGRSGPRQPAVVGGRSAE